MHISIFLHLKLNSKIIHVSSLDREVVDIFYKFISYSYVLRHKKLILSTNILMFVTVRLCHFFHLCASLKYIFFFFNVLEISGLLATADLMDDRGIHLHTALVILIHMNFSQI